MNALRHDIFSRCGSVQPFMPCGTVNGHCNAFLLPPRRCGCNSLRTSAKCIFALSLMPCGAFGGPEPDLICGPPRWWGSRPSLAPAGIQACLSVCLSVCPSVRPSVRQSVCLVWLHGNRTNSAHTDECNPAKLPVSLRPASSPPE